MKNTLFIFPQSHLRVWLLCQDALPVHREAKKDKARLHNLLSVLLIFSFLGWVRMSVTILYPESIFSASKISYVYQVKSLT